MAHRPATPTALPGRRNTAEVIPFREMTCISNNRSGCWSLNLGRRLQLDVVPSKLNKATTGRYVWLHRLAPYDPLWCML